MKSYHTHILQLAFKKLNNMLFTCLRVSTYTHATLKGAVVLGYTCVPCLCKLPVGHLGGFQLFTGVLWATLS